MYTEQDLREAYRAGHKRGMFDKAGNYFDAPLDESEYIESLKPKKEVFEPKVSFTYSFLKRKLDWEKFCDLTGIDYYAKSKGYSIEDNEIFYFTESKAKQFNLI